MKLSKEKRNQLVLVAIGTVGVMAALWFLLISYQKGRIALTGDRIREARQKIDKTQRVVKDAAQVETDLNAAEKKLEGIENMMPAGDLYSWIVSSIKQFNVPSYRVDIPQLSVPIQGDVQMFSTFPYRQASITLSGTAFFSDIGKFISDYENKFPYARIQNLYLEPINGAVNPEDREKLAFHMDIITLVKGAN